MAYSKIGFKELFLVAVILIQLGGLFLQSYHDYYRDIQGFEQTMKHQEDISKTDDYISDKMKQKNNNKGTNSNDLMEVPSGPSTSDLNVTQYAEKNILFYNRIPKAGSMTFMNLLRNLAPKNNFKVNKAKVNKVEIVLLSEEQEKATATMISRFDSPSVFGKHVAMINFSRFHLPRPIHINVVRNPVERIISWFYYIRASWHIVQRRRVFPDIALPDPSWLQKDFDTCVQDPSDMECKYIEGDMKHIADHRRQSVFFCGNRPECVPFNSRTAMNLARENIEREFGVVGVIEDLNKTLTVLQHYIPLFFRDAVETYYGSETKKNTNSQKPPVSSHTKSLVTANVSAEMELYDWCRQRLDNQFNALVREGKI